MDILPGVRAESPPAADHAGDGGQRAAGLLPDVQARDHPGYRERPERQAPESMIAREGLVIGSGAFLRPGGDSPGRNVSESDTQEASMDHIRCGLRDSWRYCQEHPGMCCRVCPAWEACDKGCLNDPERCGQASPDELRQGGDGRGV